LGPALQLTIPLGFPEARCAPTPRPNISAWDTSSVLVLPAFCSPAVSSPGSWSCRRSSSSVRTSQEISIRALSRLPICHPTICGGPTFDPSEREQWLQPVSLLCCGLFPPSLAPCVPGPRTLRPERRAP